MSNIKQPIRLDYDGVDTQKTEAFRVPDWAKYVGVHVPSLSADGDVTMEFLDDESASSTTLPGSYDTGWVNVIDPDTGIQAVVLGSGGDPAIIDITRLIRPFASGGWFRFVCGGVQTADRTFNVHFKGDK